MNEFSKKQLLSKIEENCCSKIMKNSLMLYLILFLALVTISSIYEIENNKILKIILGLFALIPSFQVIYFSSEYSKYERNIALNKIGDISMLFIIYDNYEKDISFQEIKVFLKNKNIEDIQKMQCILKSDNIYWSNSMTLVTLIVSVIIGLTSLGITILLNLKNNENAMDTIINFLIGLSIVVVFYIILFMVIADSQSKEETRKKYISLVIDYVLGENKDL